MIIYLWPYFSHCKSIAEHILSILIISMNGFGNTGTIIQFVLALIDRFRFFIYRVISLSEERLLKYRELMAIIQYLKLLNDQSPRNVFKNQLLKLLSLPIWFSMTSKKLNAELNHNFLTKQWRLQLKYNKILSSQKLSHIQINYTPEAMYITSLFDFFSFELINFSFKGKCENPGIIDNSNKQYLISLILDFLNDNISRFSTRRFIHTAIEDQAIILKCKLSCIQYEISALETFSKIVEILENFQNFEFDKLTGNLYSDNEPNNRLISKIISFQRFAYMHINKLKEFSLINSFDMVSEKSLKKYISQLSIENIRELAFNQLCLISKNFHGNIELFINVVISYFVKIKQILKNMIDIPIYPTENELFKKTLTKHVNMKDQQLFVIPKLNLEFLDLKDYFVRNYKLFQLESTEAVREDLENVLDRVNLHNGSTLLETSCGWSKMGIKIISSKILSTENPNIGKTLPSRVLGEIVYNTENCPPHICMDWNEIQPGETLFLIAFEPQNKERVNKFDSVKVRGCEMVEFKEKTGLIKTIIVSYDPVQYNKDKMMVLKGEDNHINSYKVYNDFKLLVRRKLKENNFKHELETIKEMIHEKCVVPHWILNLILGHNSSHKVVEKQMEKKDLMKLDTKCTFLDILHIFNSLNFKLNLTFVNKAAKKYLTSPFRLEINTTTDFFFDQVKEHQNLLKHGENKKRIKIEANTQKFQKSVYNDKTLRTKLQFNPRQIQAIISSMRLGLTMIIGPPGTGKTDIATHILYLLYHNYPEQKSLIVTHSNQALNDIFNKIIEKDLPLRYLLRLGLGEEELEAEQTFSSTGRINALLKRRIELLSEAKRIFKVLHIKEIKTKSFTCETLGYFWLSFLLPKWESLLPLNESCKYLSRTTTNLFNPASSFLHSCSEFFSDSLHNLSKKTNLRKYEKIRSYYDQIKSIFQEIKDIRPFEILKSHADRVDYLMTKYAKIIAMTCTQASFKRKEFIRLGLTYDNLVIEEAAQIIEIETIIPIMMQEQIESHFKRLILIGDQNQLHPVIKNKTLAKYSKFDQSLLARFIRTGLPKIELNKQGRSRTSLVKLFKWRYEELGDMENVRQKGFLSANPGFAFDYQFIDVQDYSGHGETAPAPYFYQNLAEAEYVVYVFQYMRLIGYPPWKIAILTAYNGQKALIREIIEKRCAKNPLFGRPSKVTTVDKYQGQQVDFVLLSLVKTRSIGHVRDLRRLTVALSRARLGIYIFGRMRLYNNHSEITPVLRHLHNRPTMLALFPDETWKNNTRMNSDPLKKYIIVTDLNSLSYHLLSLIRENRNVLN